MPYLTRKIPASARTIAPSTTNSFTPINASRLKPGAPPGVSGGALNSGAMVSRTGEGGTGRGDGAGGAVGAAAPGKGGGADAAGDGLTGLVPRPAATPSSAR